MSFDDRETSAFDGEPQELYWFIRGSDSWFYTSGAYGITLELNDYTPLAGLKRAALTRGQERSKNQLTIDMPRTTDIVQEFISVPKQSAIWLKIFRIHEGETDYRIFYQGRIRSVDFKGNTATLTMDDITASIYKQAFRQKFQNQCNNFMFDANCTLLEADFTDAAQTLLTVDGVTLTVDNAADEGKFISGQVKRSNGERRLVIADTKSGSTHTLTLLQPFEAMEAGEVVDLIEAACRHTFTTCFPGNEENYGGYPLVPRTDPFKSII